MLTKQVDIDALCARAEALCRRIAASDLGDEPLYIVPQSRLPDDLGGKSICDGFTTPRLDLYLQEVIGAAWRGRGPCMVFNDADFAALPSDDDYLELDVLQVVLHELAHILARTPDDCIHPSDDPMRLKFEALCLAEAVSREPRPEIVTSPFQGHEARFIRAALHLRHRADLAGTLVPMYGYCAGTHYGLSHPNRYRRALGGEPERLLGASIRKILDTPAPKAFCRLWTTDVAQWLSHCPSDLERKLPCL